MQSQILCAIVLGKLFYLQEIETYFVIKSNGMGYKDLKLNEKTLFIYITILGKTAQLMIFLREFIQIN